MDKTNELINKIKSMSLKEAMSRLNEISRNISNASQDNSTDIEGIIEMYEEGAILSQFCTKKLENAQMKIKNIQDFDYSPMLDTQGTQETTNDSSEESCTPQAQTQQTETGIRANQNHKSQKDRDDSQETTNLFNVLSEKCQ